MRAATIFLICALMLAGQYPTFSQEKIVVVSPDEQDPKVLQDAKSKLERTRVQFERDSKLYRRGSISAQQHKVSRLQFRVAKLELQLLESPERAIQIRRSIAKLNVDFERDRFESFKKLRQSGSLSELRYQRQKFRFKIADIGYRQASGKLSGTDAKLLAARTQHQLTSKELELAMVLLRQRSITRSSFDEMRKRDADAAKAVREIEEQQKKARETIRNSTKT